MRTASLIPLTALLVAAGACGEPPGPEAPLPEEGPRQAAAIATGQGQVLGIDYVGNGCSEATASTGISLDGEAFTALFSELLAVAGPEAGADQATRNCLMRVRIEVPAGWSYRLLHVTQRGFVSLTQGAGGSRRSLYQAPGNRPVIRAPAAFKGPIDDSFEQVDVGPETGLGFSECGGGQTLLIATEVRVDNAADRSAGGQLVVDSIDGELAWRRCP